MLLDDEEQGAAPRLGGVGKWLARQLEVSLVAVTIKHVIPL
jgi:hypothetical protein